MKKEQRKTIKAKIITAINKVLKTSKAEHTKKSEKVIKKSVKNIVKTMSKEADGVAS
jgi:hypothetical protein